jgi:hypothetical protein
VAVVDALRSRSSSSGSNGRSTVETTSVATCSLTDWRVKASGSNARAPIASSRSFCGEEYFAPSPDSTVNVPASSFVHRRVT